MGLSEFEFRPIGSFRYIEGYLVWRLQKKQARDTLFQIAGVARLKLGCSIKTYKILAIINSKAYYTNGLL